MGNAHATKRAAVTSLSGQAADSSSSLLEACQMRDLEQRMVRDRSERKYLQNSGVGLTRKPLLSVTTGVLEDVDDDIRSTRGGEPLPCYSPTSGSDDHENSVRTLQQIIGCPTPLATSKPLLANTKPPPPSASSSFYGSRLTPEVMSSSRPSTSSSALGETIHTPMVNPLTSRLAMT